MGVPLDAFSKEVCYTWTQTCSNFQRKNFRNNLIAKFHSKINWFIIIIFSLINLNILKNFSFIFKRVFRLCWGSKHFGFATLAHTFVTAVVPVLEKGCDSGLTFFVDPGQNSFFPEFHQMISCTFELLYRNDGLYATLFLVRQFQINTSRLRTFFSHSDL